MKSVIFVAALMAACGTDTAKQAAATADSSTPIGAQSEQGPQGPAGPAGPQGPKGDKGDTGAAGTDGTSGTNGTAGVAGSDGTNGTNGQTGQTGGLDLFNSADVQVGTLFDPMNAATVVLPDGGFFDTSLFDGSYYGTAGFDGNTAVVFPTCAFTTADCSGTCYMVNGSSMGDDLDPVVNSVIWDGTALWRYAGDEVRYSGLFPMKSYWKENGTPLNTCATQTLSINMAWTMTHAETLPTGVTFPFGALHFTQAQ